MSNICSSHELQETETSSRLTYVRMVILRFSSNESTLKATYAMKLKMFFFFFFFFLFPFSYSQYPQSLPSDPTPSHPRGKRPHFVLQRHPGAHAADLRVRHLVGEEGDHIGGNFGIWSPGRGDRRGEVCEAIRRRRHPIGSRKERIV